MKRATIGERARAIRESRKLKQSDVAASAGWHVTDLCNLERGRGPASPGIERVARLAAALGVTVDVLLGVGGSAGRQGAGGSRARGKRSRRVVMDRNVSQPAPHK